MYLPATAVTQALDESVHGVAPAASAVPSGPDRSASPEPTIAAATAITAMRVFDIHPPDLSDLRRCSTQAARILPRTQGGTNQVARIPAHHSASWAPSGVLGVSSVKGKSSSQMARQLAVALRRARMAPTPNSMRLTMTSGPGTFAHRSVSWRLLLSSR